MGVYPDGGLGHFLGIQGKCTSAHAGPSTAGTQWQQAQRPWKALKKLGNKARPRRLQNRIQEASGRPLRALPAAKAGLE